MNKKILLQINFTFFEKINNNFFPLFSIFTEMARGSIGRERMISGVVSSNISSHQPPSALQEDLNNELLAVCFKN